MAYTKCGMTIPTLQLFQVDVDCQNCSSLEDNFNLYNIFHKNLNNKRSECESLNPTPLNKRLRYADDISDSELVACEMATSASKIKTQ